MPEGVDLTAWVHLVRRVQSLTQQSKEQSTVGSVYCTALLSDIEKLENGGFGGGCKAVRAPVQCNKGEWGEREVWYR